jgi:hypothetical protein
MAIPVAMTERSTSLMIADIFGFGRAGVPGWRWPLPGSRPIGQRQFGNSRPETDEDYRRRMKMNCSAAVTVC